MIHHLYFDIMTPRIIIIINIIRLIIIIIIIIIVIKCCEAWLMLTLFLLSLPDSGHPKESNFIPHFIVIRPKIFLYGTEFSHD